MQMKMKPEQCFLYFTFKPQRKSFQFKNFLRAYYELSIVIDTKDSNLNESF